MDKVTRQCPQSATFLKREERPKTTPASYYTSFIENGNVLTEPMDMDCDEPAANSSSQYQQYSPPPSRLTVTLICPLSIALDITRPTPTVHTAVVP